MNKTFTETSSWIVERIAYDAEIAPSEVDPDAQTKEYRLDSFLVADTDTELHEWLRIELSPSIFREKGTIIATTQWIAENLEA